MTDFIELSNKKEGVISEMGRLMNESQNSCRDLYECSSTNIDRLMEIG